MSNKTQKLAHWYKIKCPFFHGDNFNSIICEGIIKDSAIRHIFPSSRLKEEWEHKYCTGINCFKQCPLYILADKKYKSAD